MASTQPICSKPQIIGGVITAVVGLAATAIATRLFKEKVTLVLAAGLPSTLILTGVVVLLTKPKQEETTPPFPTKKEEVQAWLDHHGKDVATQLKDSEAETKEKVELLGWMEDAKRMEVLKELNPRAELFTSYFDGAHEDEYVTWVEEKKPDWTTVIAMKPALIKLAIKADQTKTGFELKNIASLMRGFGKEAPAIAATVKNDDQGVVMKKAVQVYAECLTDNDAGYWAEFDGYFKDSKLCQSALDGLWGRMEFTANQYIERLKKLTDAELLNLFPGLKLMFCPDEFARAVAINLQDLDTSRDTLRDQIMVQEPGTEAMLAFLIRKVDTAHFAEMNLKRYLESVTSAHAEVRDAALERIRSSGTFNQWLPADSTEALDALGKILKNGDTTALDTAFVDAVNSERQKI